MYVNTSIYPYIFTSHSLNQNTLATIDWCESNYTRSILLAEYWNAFSASVVALFSLYLLRVAYAV